MPPTPRGRRHGGPFEVSKRPHQVLEHLGITKDDVWWRKSLELVETELSHLRGKALNSNLTWLKLEVRAESQTLCVEALQTVLSELQKIDASPPQRLQDSTQVRRVINWMFSYQYQVLRDNASHKSKSQRKTLSRQSDQETWRNLCSPTTGLASGLNAVGTDDEQYLKLGLRTKQVVDTELSAQAAGRSISNSTIQASTINSHSTPALPPRKFEYIPSFICVAGPRTPNQSIGDFPSIAIRCPTKELSESYVSHRMYSKANMAEMEKKYGIGYASYDASSEPPTAVLHQDLAMWHLLSDFGRKLGFENWAWIHKQAQLLRNPNSRCVEQATAFRPGNHSFVFLLHPGSLNARLRQSYTILETQVHSTPGSIALFPALTELEHTCQKFGDLTALDELATEKHYRPKTCFVGRGRYHFPHDGCPLSSEQRYMAKRNNSACSMHVFEMESAVNTELRQESNHAEPALGVDRWFYQERVPLLKDVGEFRVFLTTASDIGAIRGRRGKHLHSIFTKPSQTLGFTAFALDDYFWSQYLDVHFAPLTQDDLHAFALEIYEGLRARSDWKMYYESLDIGVRLDIGISPDKRFFVNEITRIWCGDFFSDQTLAEPKRKIVWAVAKALHEYFQ